MAKTRSRRTRSRKTRGVRRSCRGRKAYRPKYKSRRCRTAKTRARNRGRGRSASRRTGRARRNPQMERRLKDGTVIQLHEEGGGMSRLMVHHPDGRLDDSRLTDAKALSRFKQFKSGKRYRHRAERSEWATLAADNPRRRGRGRGSKARRNCGSMRRNPGQFPMPFVSAMNPRIRKGEARSMSRVLRRHGYKRCRV
jgi:hypothetical protein